MFGIEADIDWTGFNGSTVCQFGTTCETRNNWLGTARGRVGYSWAQANSWGLIMPYVTGGLAFGNIEANQSGFGSVSDTNLGWTVGAGLEGAINRNWTAKVEYLYADLGDTNCGVPVCSIADQRRPSHEHRARRAELPLLNHGRADVEAPDCRSGALSFAALTDTNRPGDCANQRGSSDAAITPAPEW